MKKTVIELERIFSRICRESHPLEWDENHLSFQLMRQLSHMFSNRVINFNGWSKIVDWRSFKNRGKQETAYGDIALLVNVQFGSGESLHGVANLEAKRDYNSGGFEALDNDQLNHIFSGLPYSHLLLYTHSSQKLPLKFPNESEWESHMWVSPLNTATQLLEQTPKSQNARVLRTSFPLTMFLTGRVFWGLDLDFRKEIFDAIKEGLDKIINPSFLGVINVYYENQRPYNIDLAEVWEEL